MLVPDVNDAALTRLAEHAEDEAQEAEIASRRYHEAVMADNPVLFREGPLSPAPPTRSE